MSIFAASIFSDMINDPSFFISRIFVLTLSLSFHEFAHAWVANRLGDDTAAMQGRLTLNPLKHLDPIGSLMFLIAGIGWAKPVPVNPVRFTRENTMKSGMMKVSLAGPVSNLLLATVSCVLLFIVLTIAEVTGSSNAILVFSYDLTRMLYFSNIILAVFNLLPVPPLDGYKVFGSLLPNSLYFKIMQYERYIGMAFLFLVLFGRGVLTSILSVIQIPFNYVIFKPIQFVFEKFWTIL